MKPEDVPYLSPMMERLVRVLLWAATLGVVAAYVAAEPTAAPTAAPTPLPEVKFSTAPCTQSMSTEPGAYSGPLAVIGDQWGIETVNAYTQRASLANGVCTYALPHCTCPKMSDPGDCHQSVAAITASNGAPKWFVTPYGPQMCGVVGLTVWKWDGIKPVFKGVIDGQVWALGTPILDGDIAYSPTLNNAKYLRFDLNAMTRGGEVTTKPAGEGRQQNIAGYTYPLVVPDPSGSPNFTMKRSGQEPTVTGTPPTAAPTFTRSATWTPTTGTRTPNVTQPPPDPCILSGRTCTPTPGVTAFTPSRTRTPTFAFSPTARPTVTPTPAAARFAIAVTWTAPDGRTGSGTPSCSLSAGSSGDSSTGYWFFSSSNIELFISVLPSYCSTHPNVMVKLMGATSVDVLLTVTDHQTGKSWTYHNPQGQIFQTQINTSALPCQ